MLAIDARGNLSGACTTSGMAWKMHGRVGDSPSSARAYYVDNEVGGATSTGVGEEVIRSVGSFPGGGIDAPGHEPAGRLQGGGRAHPEAQARRQERCRSGYLAINKKGEVGAWAIQKGFSYSLCDQTSQDRIVPGQAFLRTNPR